MIERIFGIIESSNWQFETTRHIQHLIDGKIKIDFSASADLFKSMNDKQKI